MWTGKEDPSCLSSFVCFIALLFYFLLSLVCWLSDLSCCGSVGLGTLTIGWWVDLSAFGATVVRETTTSGMRVWGMDDAGTGVNEHQKRRIGLRWIIFWASILSVHVHLISLLQALFNHPHIYSTHPWTDNSSTPSFSTPCRTIPIRHIYLAPALLYPSVPNPPACVFFTYKRWQIPDNIFLIARFPRVYLSCPYLMCE